MMGRVWLVYKREKFVVEGRALESDTRLISIHSTEWGARQAYRDMPTSEKLNDDVTIEYSYIIDDWSVEL